MKLNSVTCGWVAILGVVLVTFGGASAADPVEDPFDLKFRDPRSVPAVKAEPSDKPGEAWITVNGQRILVKIGAIEPAGPPLTFSAVASPSVVAPGQVFRVTITGQVAPPYHTYPLTADKEKRGFPHPVSSISFQKAAEDNFLALTPVAESTTTPHKSPDPKDPPLQVYEGKFEWGLDFLVDPKAKPGDHTLRLPISAMYCDEHNCTNVKPELAIPVTVRGDPVAPPTGFNDRVIKDSKSVGSATTATTSGGDVETPEQEGELLPLLLTSVLGAIGMLFTPCVFPMIPITVSFFLKQSEKKHHNAPLTAGVYCLTIIVVLALAVVLLGQLIVVWANSVWLNLALAVMLIVFSLSLFGMYDIELPTFLTKWTSSGEGRGGYLGAVFMALTFTITSFTCTGPFLGPLLVATSQMAGVSFWYRLLAAFAYAATFAAPFFVLALFPGLLKKLPKSGGWLNAVKVVMGFLELAAALKFLGNVDVTLNPGSPWLFTYDTVLVSWIALSAACGLYLLGLFRLPHDTPQEHVGVPRMVLATIFLGLAVYITPALWRETPTGILGQGLVAFLPYDTRPPSAAKGGGESVQEFMDYQQAWEAAKKENKLIFIDFTGVQCTNCFSNERNVFTRPEVRKELEKYVVVKLYTDSVPDRSLSAVQASQQADFNKRLQSNTFGNITLPLYVMFDPDRQTPIADERLLGQTLGKEEGLITDVNAFLEKLRKPLAGRGDK